jgi:hypothetical protein
MKNNSYGMSIEVWFMGLRTYFHNFFDSAIIMLVVKYVLCESGLSAIISDISYVFLIALFQVSTGLSHVNVLACFTG